MATVLASAIIDTVMMPILLQRKLGLSIVRLIRHAWLRRLATGVCQAACAAIRLIGQPTSRPALAIQSILAGVASCVVVLAIGTGAVERQRYVFKPIRRLWGIPAEATGA